ncbi:MAG: hypothetical protein J6U04_06375 [Salinivirgaceae bacterium]|nr:hypothetical protein [Salinivirgaceae bacterium]
MYERGTEKTIEGKLTSSNYLSLNINEGSLKLARWNLVAKFVAAQLANPVLALQDEAVIMQRAKGYAEAMFELRKPKNTNRNED